MLSKGFEKTAVDWSTPPAEAPKANAAAMQAGATASGWQPKQWMANIKAGLGLAGTTK